MSIWKGIQLYNCSLEFSLHAIAALNATHAMLVFGEHCCEEEAGRNEEDDTAEMIGVSSSSCLRPQRNATERLVDGAELFDGLFSTSANLAPLQYDIPPYAVLAHDANRRLFTLLKYSHVWASNIIANIGVGSFIGTPLSWCEHNVDKLRAKWQLAVFLGVPACVFPPLPTRKQQDGSDDSILTLRRIAEFLLGCVAGAASASSREAQCWVPCTLRDGHDTAGYIRWREFCSCLAIVAAERHQYHLTSCIRPMIEELHANPTSTTPPPSDAILWLGEAVAAVVLAPPHEGDVDDAAMPMCCDPPPLWGGVAPAQCSVAKAVGSHTTPLATENILLRNIVSRGAIPFAAPTALCELDIAHSFTATLSQLETNWTRVGAVNGDTEQQSTDNNNISVANAAAQRRDRHKFRALEDKLQVPLQPLGDHLDGGVYQTFEQDRPKYLQYYRAVRAYLEDCKLEEEAGVNNTNGDADHLVTVLVLGAGRGPLVSECLIAATDADVRVHVIALEKNPAAVQFLRCKHQLDPAWKHLEDFCGHQVSIVHGDGRTLASTVMMNSAIQYLLMFASVSCVVSELLGSAGDNELSPECIDGTMVELGKIRNAADAIDLRRLNRPITSIPANVTFFATPVQSATLAHQIRSRRDGNGGHPPSALSTIYVSHMTRAVMLDEPQAVWSFEHPPATATTTARDADTTFSSHRRAVVQFSIPPRGRVDVLGGYFTSLLYKSAGGVEHMLSTVPARWDPVGMYSWFPCVFPVLGGQPTCSDSLLHMQRDLVADESLSTTLRVEFLRGVRDTSETDLSSSSKSSVSSHGVFTSWRAKLLPPTGSRNAADVVLDDGAWGWHNDNGSAAVVRL